MKLTQPLFTCMTLTILVLVVFSSAVAETYEYVDENGTISFTDDPVKIPKSRNKTTKVRPKIQESESMTETLFKLVNNHIVVPVTVSYKGRDIKGQFVLDTGAASSLISPNIAKQLDINPRDSDIAMIQGVTGFGLVGSVILDTISIGPQRVGSVEVAVTSVGTYDGLLGNDVLNSSRFQIDFNARRIRWQ